MPESIATITIDRQAEGRLTIQVRPSDSVVVDEGELPGLIEGLRERLALEVIFGGSGGIIRRYKLSEEDIEAILRDAISMVALRNEEIDELNERHPVPQAYREEPGWDDL